MSSLVGWVGLARASRSGEWIGEEVFLLAIWLSLLAGLPAAIVAWGWLRRGLGRRAALILVALSCLAAVFSLKQDFALLRVAVEAGTPLAACAVWAALQRPARSPSLAVSIVTCCALLLGTANSLGYLEQRLVAAASRGDLEAVAWCLRAGLDIEATHAEGRSPLMAAVEAGDAGMVQLLLERGASPLRADGSGDSPMLRSIELGATEITVLLLGAPPPPPDQDARSQAESIPRAL